MQAVNNDVGINANSVVIYSSLHHLLRIRFEKVYIPTNNPIGTPRNGVRAKLAIPAVAPPASRLNIDVIISAIMPSDISNLLKMMTTTTIIMMAIIGI